MGLVLHARPARTEGLVNVEAVYWLILAACLITWLATFGQQRKD